MRFIDENEFEKNHKSLAHGGRVAATSSGAKLDFSIALQSNPDFTAKILLTYARAAVKMNKDGLVIACGEGAVEITSLQAEGGKRMAAPDYFRGHPLEP